MTICALCMQVVGLMSNGGYNEETDSGDVYLWLGGSMLSTGRDRKVLESCRPNCRFNLGIGCFQRAVLRRFIQSAIVLML